MAYKLFYAFVFTTTTFELVWFLMWFLFDISFASVAITSAYPRHERRIVVVRLFGLLGTSIGFLYVVCKFWLDEREQVTAYWTGALLATPIGWTQLALLIYRGDTKGQSLEIW